MEGLGSAAARVAVRAKDGDSQASRLHALALPAKREADGLPVRFDRDVDFEIPRRLICWRPDHGSVEIRRLMRPDERAAVEARSAALELALRPFEPEQIADIEASIGAMFAGFRSMRQQGEAAADVVTITRAVLREFPAWAITAACLKIARHETRCDPRFAPNDAEIVDVVAGLIKQYREARDAAVLLLDSVVADIADTRSRSSIRAANAPAVPISDGKHTQRVAADLKARKARNEEAEAARTAGEERPT